MAKGTRFVIGMDLGDGAFHLCVIDRRTGENAGEGEIGAGRADVEQFFGGLDRSSVVMEVASRNVWK